MELSCPFYHSNPELQTYMCCRSTHPAAAGERVGAVGGGATQKSHYQNVPPLPQASFYEPSPFVIGATMHYQELSDITPSTDDPSITMVTAL